MASDIENVHRPVLLEETLSVLNAGSGGLFVDASLGLGGHTGAILDSSPDPQVIGIDQDPDAIAAARKRLERFSQRVEIVHASFAEIKDVVRRVDKGSPNGILADLGVSSMQLDTGDRGFSLRHDAPLDMRMNPDAGTRTAAELLADLSEEEIANVIYRFGEERASRKIARRIVERRERGEPVATTTELAELVRRVVRTDPRERTHPATRTFQALRIAVNNELDILNGFIDDSVDVLAPGGVLAMITFHSLEDRIVKQAFQRLSGKCQCPPRMPVCQCGAVKRVEVITRKPVVPSETEMRANSRSSSAKLRACRKLLN
jgi:16S rRNA (cytosine1402-N4)-methyltransferase